MFIELASNSLLMSTHHQSRPDDEPFNQYQQFSPHIEVRIRHDLQGATDRIDDILSRLERLTDQDHIESFALVGWHCQACSPIKTTPEAPIRPRNIVRATIAEFTKWAAQHDYSLGPAFGQPADQPPAEAEGEEAGQIDLPIICVAVYDREPDTAEPEAKAATSGRLVAVYPYVDEEGNVKTVENGLSALEEQSPDQ